MNKVILTGRLTKEPEVRYTPNGKAVASFTLAVDNGFGENKKTDFIPIVVWGNSAEFCGNNLNKGSKVLVDGRLQVRSYDAKDGSKRYVTEVIANNLEALERRQGASVAKSEDKDQVQDVVQSFGSDVDLNDEVPF